MKKTAFVTGADFGHTGYAIAAKFADNGYDVVITCIDEATVAQAAEKLRENYGVDVHPYVLDLRNKDQAAAIFSDLDKKGIALKG